MNSKITVTLCTLAVLLITGVVIYSAESSPETLREEDPPHIVFISGDQEYRSEESMPMLARIFKNRYGFDVTVLYALTDGIIDPTRMNNIEGLEALESADLMVMFTRFLRLPENQLKYIVDFAESGKPMAGFRTATHAFRYGEDHPNHHMDTQWPHEVFGLPWRGRGEGSSTDVDVIDEQADHPVLRGVEPFHALSHLYHSDILKEQSDPLLTGRSVSGSEPGGEFTGEAHPVAWTHTYDGKQGTSRIFFTTLGHPRDFFRESMRKLAVNGLFWALGMEDEIPEDGLNADFAGSYDPNDAGFGDAYKPDMRPEDIPLSLD